MGTDLDCRRPASSPATATQEDAVEWVPLRKHPFFTTTSAVSMAAAGEDASASSAQKPGNLFAWDSVASRLYVWDCEKFGLHRLSLSFGDDDDHDHPHDPASILAATPWKMFRPDNRLQFTVHNISINRAGTSVVLFGSGGLCVMYLYKRNSRKDGSIVCNTVSVGSQLYLDENNFVETLQASWHPHSDTHLGVLSSDSVFRLFDLSFDVEKAEQEFYLQPVEHGFGNNAGSICPVAFSFGGEHLWDRFSVFFLFSDGSVYIICPVVPFRSFYSWASIQDIYRDAQTFGLKSSNPQAVSNSNLAISWLEATFPLIADQPMEESTLLALKAHPYVPFDASLSLQGPLRKVCHDGEDQDSRIHRAECEGRAISFFYNSISKDTVLVIGWSSGQLQIDALADEIQPLWNIDSSPRLRVNSSGFVIGVAMICDLVQQEDSVAKPLSQVNQENLETFWLGHPPPLLRLALVDLALPTNAVNSDSLLIFKDPIVSERIYCVHSGGVDMILLHFLPFSSQMIGKDEAAKAPSVYPILSTCQSDMHAPFPLHGFVALSDSFGTSWIIGVTSSRECIVIDMKGWDTTLAFHVYGDEKSICDTELGETGPADIISKELLIGPKAILLPQWSSALSSLPPDSIDGRSALHHHFKLFHENYVEYAHKVYIELKHHGDHLKKIIADQHTRLNDAKQLLFKVEEKQPSVENRIKRAVQRYGILEERLQRFRNLPGANKKPLSRAEREFVSQLDHYKELELGALRISIETLNTRLRRYVKSAQVNRQSPPRQVPGRRNHLPEAQISQLKSSMEKLSLLNSENSKKVKLVESALTSRENIN